MPLEEYRAKRDFTHTPEPSTGTPSSGALSFVIQKHHARALHYDFRLELDGVLVSWAVPKGPSLDPHDKHLAVHVEDHPLDYGGFEGTIPAGEYGAGSVIVWDRGTWEPLGDPHAGLEKGDFKFILHGEKLHGTWVLVRMKPRPGEKRDNWLLIKEKDEFVRPHEEYDILAEEPDSVLGGSSVDDPPTTAEASEPPASAPSAPFPRAVDFELATLVDTAPEGDAWIAEVKYDGYRLALALHDEKARAFTRNHKDWSDRFSGLTRAMEALPATSAIIDGEAIVYGPDGVSQFELLQKAFGPHPERVVFSAFDLLYLNGYDLRELPLLQRKELLHNLLAEQPPGFPIRYADHVVGGAGDFFGQACRSDLEGIVCKRATSKYLPGRGREWVKVKCRQSQEFVVGGFTEGGGARSPLGSVLVGTYDGARLVFAGRVGSGFDDASVASMRKSLDALERATSPFDPPPHITGHVVHWTRPEVVVEVAFREWTSEGVLRQPVFLGVREDKAAKDVVHERPTREEPAKGETKGKRGRSDSDKDAPKGGATEKKPPAETTADARKPKAASAGEAGKVLGIYITNPSKALFPDSPEFTKLDFAEYYAKIAPAMLPEVTGRCLTLLRCPTGEGRGCFYQRHPDKGLSEHIHRLKHTLKAEEFEFLYIDSAEGLVALAQMGAGEVHTWLSRIDEPTRPDRICFDLDPGPDVDWPQIRSAALLVREECEGLGFSAFLKSTGSKGLHVVLPIEPVWDFTRVRAFSKRIVDRLVSRYPETLVGKMAKDARGGRIFFDYLRNAEGASAVAAYSTRMKSGPSCSVPLKWGELTDQLDIRAYTPARVLRRVAAGSNPWKGIDDASVGARVLRRAESALEG